MTNMSVWSLTNQKETNKMCMVIRDHSSARFINWAYVPFSVPKIHICKCFHVLADKNNLNKFKSNEVKKKKAKM